MRGEVERVSDAEAALWRGIEESGQGDVPRLATVDWYAENPEVTLGPTYQLALAWAVAQGTRAMRTRNHQVGGRPYVWAWHGGHAHPDARHGRLPTWVFASEMPAYADARFGARYFPALRGAYLWLGRRLDEWRTRLHMSRFLPTKGDR